MQQIASILLFIKGTEHVVSSEPLFTTWQVWFTTVSSKPLSDHGWMRYSRVSCWKNGLFLNRYLIHWDSDSV